MATIAFHNTYATGKQRLCPICRVVWPSAKLAIRCWYIHPTDQGGSESLTNMPISRIAGEMGVSEDTVRRAWRWLVDTLHAPPRRGGPLETGETYAAVVTYLRQTRGLKRGLTRGWTQRLGDDLNVSRQRVHQIKDAALAKGDL